MATGFLYILLITTNMDSLIMILYGVVGLIGMGLEPETFHMKSNMMPSNHKVIDKRINFIK